MTTTTTQPQNKELIVEPIEKFFASITAFERKSQTEYWNSIIPQNDSERFQRFLFAYCSVHTTWESNIKAYNLIKNWWEWMNQWEMLE